MAQQTNDPLATEISNGLGQLKVERLTSLSDAADTHVALQSALLNEAQRIEARLGAEDIRTKLLRNRAQSNALATQTLKAEEQLTQFNLPEIEAEGALVYGRIADEDGLGIDRLLVNLVNPTGAPIDITAALSEDSGGFAIALDSQTVDRVMRDSPLGVLPTVSTPRGRVIYVQSKPVTLAHGARVRIEIRLSRTDWAQVPAPPAPGSYTLVPDLIGKTETDALNILKKANLKLGRINAKVAPNQPGIVLEQNPAADSSVPAGSLVNLTVGVAGAATVPDLVGATLRTAKSRLKTAELTLGQVGGLNPTDASIVDTQSPAAGAAVAIGTAVDVTVGDLGRPRPTGKKKE